MARAEEPTATDERELLLGWLAFHRDALESKCEGVDASALIRTGLGGSSMSLLGLVRHLTEMERVYVTHAVGGVELEFVYGPYEEGGPDGDFDGLDESMVGPSFDAWRREREDADRHLAAAATLDDAPPGSTRTVRWCLIKVIQEYARHNGHADLIRQSIDGATGE